MSQDAKFVVVSSAGPTEPVGSTKRPHPVPRPASKLQGKARHRCVVLSKLDEFLPRLKESNAELLKDPASHVMETCSSDGPVIKMTLGLGVLEERNPESAGLKLRPDAVSDGDESDGRGKLVEEIN